METRTVKTPTSSLDRFVGLSTKNLFNRFSQSWRKIKKQKKSIQNNLYFAKQIETVFLPSSMANTPNALQHKKY